MYLHNFLILVSVIILSRADDFDKRFPFPCADPGDMAALLGIKKAFINFDTAVRRKDGLWDPALPMCGWQGVTCWPDGAVQKVSLRIPARAPPAMTPLTAPGGDNTSFAHACVPQRLVGGLFVRVSRSCISKSEPYKRRKQVQRLEDGMAGICYMKSLPFSCSYF